MTQHGQKSPEHEPLPVLIEKAAPEDALAIMKIKRAGWMAAYVSEEHGVTIEDMQKKFHDEIFEQGVLNWTKGIATEHEGGSKQTFVARHNGKVAGFTSPTIEDSGRRRLGALYVDPELKGQGIGSKLLARALEWHGPAVDVYVHVVAYNQPSIAFYEKHGFEKTGISFAEVLDKHDGTKLLPEIEMVHRGKNGL